MLKTEARRSRPGRHSELVKDVLKMTTGGVVADNELRRYLAVAFAGRHEPEDFELSLGQAVDVA